MHIYLTEGRGSKLCCIRDQTLLHLDWTAKRVNDAAKSNALMNSLLSGQAYPISDNFVRFFNRHGSWRYYATKYCLRPTRQVPSTFFYDPFAALHIPRSHPVSNQTTPPEVSVNGLSRSIRTMASGEQQHFSGHWTLPCRCCVAGRDVLEKLAAGNISAPTAAAEYRPKHKQHQEITPV